MPAARILLYAATLGVLVFVACAVLMGPPALVTSVTVCFAYAALFMSGVLSPSLSMFADVVVRGPKDARGVALTFDDGPHPVHTRKVLDSLDAAKAVATFFVIGKKAEQSPDVVREIVARGHAIGLHSYAHDRFFSMRPPSRIEADLRQGILAIEKITGKKPEMFRPPIGHTTPAIARVAEELDLAIVGWSVRGIDGIASAEPAVVAARVRAGLRDGAIIALHDAAERTDAEPAGVRALAEILKAIDERGLSVVALDGWI